MDNKIKKGEDRIIKKIMSTNVNWPQFEYILCRPMDNHG
jgi:hypothetical protein